MRETVPDWVVDEADELVFVDLTPRALRNRLERGVVYAPEKAHRAMENFFTETNLTALREMALRHTAHEVEEKLDADAAATLAESPGEPPAASPPAGRAERILICLTGRPVLRHPDSPRQARGRLHPCRLPGVHVGGDSAQSRGRGAPHELCAQPAHRHPRHTREGCAAAPLPASPALTE